MESNTCPQHLYKYLVPERIDALDKAILRYSPFGAFNDPFEGRPHIPRISSDEHILEIFDQVIPDEVFRGYEQLPAQIRSRLSFEQFSTMAAELVDHRKSQMIKQIHSFTPNVTEFFHKKVDGLLGALCLSEVPDNQLMWAHYGASLTGFVLELDACHEHFHEQRSPDDELRHLRRVVYQDERPSGNLSDMNMTKWMLIKESGWAYEKEWRIFRAFSDAQIVIPGTPYPIHLFSFPRQALKGVILGARITPEVEEKIRQVLLSYEEYSLVQLKRVYVDGSSYALHVARVD